MRAFATVSFLAACILAFGLPAQAQNETFTMTADSTIDGNDGVLMRITATGEPGSTAFLFDDGGMVRAYAFRDDGSQIWNVLPGSQFICPTTTMAINDTWRALDEDGDETLATVVAQENVTVPPGTFLCFKVEIVKVNAPSVVIQDVWFSSGTGLIRQTDIFPVFWRSDLFSYQVNAGSGYFPLGAGNIWNYYEAYTPVEPATWGAIKAQYE